MIALYISVILQISKAQVLEVCGEYKHWYFLLKSSLNLVRWCEVSFAIIHKSRLYPKQSNDNLQVKRLVFLLIQNFNGFHSNSGNEKKIWFCAKNFFCSFHGYNGKIGKKFAFASIYCRHIFLSIKLNIIHCFFLPLVIFLREWQLNQKFIYVCFNKICKLRQWGLTNQIVNDLDI